MDTMLRSKINHILIGLMCLTSGALGQSANCNIATSSKCSSGNGMISGVDSFTVTANLYNTSGNGPQLAQFLTRRNTETAFNRECIVNLFNCGGVPNTNCNCVKNGTEYTAYFIKTATVDPYDRAEIRLTWGSALCSSNVDIIEDFSTKCAPPDVTSSANPGECQLIFPVAFCCNSSLSPVSTTIMVDNVTYTDGSCVNLTESDAVYGNYAFTSTVCGTPVHSVSCSRSPGNNRRVSDDEDCDTGCKVGIGCGVAVIVLGGIVIAVIYYYKRNKCGADHPEDGTPPNINVVVIIIKSKECLDKLAKLVIEDLGKKGLACKGKHVIKYKGVIEENRKTELASLFAVAVGVIKVTINVCKDGIFEIVGVVSVAVLEISVKASESLDQLKDKVMDDLSKKHPDRKSDRLAFFLDGEKLNDMTITLGVLFTGLEDGMMLTVIVHLDGSRKCEIKGPEPTGSSLDSKLIKNNAVRDSRM